MAMAEHRRLLSSGSSFEAQIGYSRAVVDGDFLFVSGTTAFDYATMRISDDVAEQGPQAMHNIASALKEAGASLADVVRVLHTAEAGGLRGVPAGIEGMPRGSSPRRDDARGGTV